VNRWLFDTTVIDIARRNGAKLFFVTRNVRDVQASGAAIINPWEDDVVGFPLG